MITPQLRKLMDDINSRYSREIAFQYADKTTALLTVTGDTLTITSDCPQLIPTLGKLMERILSGDVKGVIDKRPE
jgi:hypothetical protein